MSTASSSPPATAKARRTLAGHGAASTGPRAAQWLRTIVLGPRPRGGGTTRKRASDAFRLGSAAVAVAVSVPVTWTNSALELGVVHALNPPLLAIQWLVTAAVFWLGSARVIASLVIFGDCWRSACP